MTPEQIAGRLCTMHSLAAAQWTDFVGYAELGVKLLADPALPHVLQLGQQIAAAETGPSGNNPGAPGIGLEHAVLPLEIFLFTRRHPWVPYVALPLALLLPFGIGLLVGRSL